MCGLAGTARAADKAPGADRAEEAADHLHRRGPDGTGLCRWAGTDRCWTLVHTRLAVVDLSDAAAQPMENEDGSLVMVFNGEIYNSSELRRLCEARGHVFRSAMDGEVILHLWEMEGPACLARLNGIFAVVVASRITGEVVLARDPLGVKPLYFTHEPTGDLWFASEPRAIEAMGAPVGDADVVALAQFLSFLWIPGPRSPKRGVRALQPGHILTWEGGTVRVSRFCEPMVPQPRRSHSQQAATLVAELGNRLRAAADRQLMADVPVGLLASGGVDSSLLWWAGRGGLDQAYTITWEEGDDEEGLADDHRAVRSLEQRFGTPVVYLMGEDGEDSLPPSGDLFADPAYGLTRLIAAAARERGQKVLWSGQGGDELFGGYRRHVIAPLLPRLSSGAVAAVAERWAAKVPSRRLAAEYATRMARAAVERDPFRAYMQLCTYSTPKERAEALGCDEAEVGDDVVWQHHQEAFDQLPGDLSFLRRVMAVDLQVYLPGLGLAYADRGGMEFGVEIRVPWLDLDLVRWSLGLPDSALLRRGRGKWLPKALASSHISAQEATRPKRGFAAPARRIRGERDHGTRGFRQGAYFARARRIVEEHLRERAGA